MEKIKTHFIIISFVLLLGCINFKESAFSDQLETSLRNQNIAHLNNIKNINLGDDFKIAFVADSHQNYAELEDVIDHINASSNIDFVVFGGDLTNSSYAYEYDLLGKALEKLRKPFLTVIGNHDALGAGKSIFEKMFGPTNFTLEFSNTRFIFFNNNTLEYKDEGIDFNWLQNEVDNSASFDQVILVNHINLFNRDYFTTEQIDFTSELLRESNIDILLNGHLHKFATFRHEGVLVHQTSRVEEAKYSTIEINNSEITIEQCRRNSCQTIELP